MDHVCTSRKLRAAICAVAMVGGLLVWAASPASAATIIVNPGQSIQAAVDAAPPGSTVFVRPGTYAETVTITTPAIRLQGSGSGQTRIVPPVAPGGPCDFGPDFAQGICVMGNLDPETFEVISFVRGVTVAGFSVSGFSGSGIFVAGGSSTTIEANRTNDNGEYGIFVLESTGTRIRSNQANNNAVAGIYVGDSPNANASITGNNVAGNQFGFFIRAAVGGTLSGNDARQNCAGVFMLGDPVDVADWTVSGNVVSNNSRACPGGEEGPPLSGQGITVLFGNNIRLNGNRVLNNVPGGPTQGSHGIGVLFSDQVFVTQNTAFGNNPDIFWDQTGVATFVGNRCAISVPPGLCA
jgi:parallel beta-helix repeat protein